MDSKWYKFNVNLIGYIEASSPEEADKILTERFQFRSEQFESDIDDILIDELLSDEE